MKIILILPLIIALSACATTPKGEPTKREEWKALEAKSGVVKGTVKGRRGETTEYIFVQDSDIGFEMSLRQSELAKACEDFARKKPAQTEWLESCTQALADTSLSQKNWSITQFNKALILENLDRRDEAKQNLRTLIKNDSNFSEADFELARLEYEDGNFSEASQQANSAIAKAYGARAEPIT